MPARRVERSPRFAPHAVARERLSRAETRRDDETILVAPRAVAFARGRRSTRARARVENAGAFGKGRERESRAPTTTTDARRPRR